MLPAEYEQLASAMHRDLACEVQDQGRRLTFAGRRLNGDVVVDELLDKHEASIAQALGKHAATSHNYQAQVALRPYEGAPATKERIKSRATGRSSYCTLM